MLYRLMQTLDKADEIFGPVAVVFFMVYLAMTLASLR